MYLLTIIYVYLILCQNHSLLRNVALIGITQMIMSMITPFMTISKKKNVFNESVIPCSILVPRAFWRGREKALGTRMTVLMSNSYLNIVH